MMVDRWMRAAALGLWFAAGACAGDDDEARRPPAATDSVPAAADSADRPADAASADSVEPGLAVMVEPHAAGFVMRGRTDAAALELSVEDGHNVLFGPTEVEVRGGAFRVELALERTDRPTVFAYLVEPGGARQWVVPIPRDGTRVTWGEDPASPADSIP
jgi:hypothetical protein